MHNQIGKILVMGIVALCMSACGALEIGIEHVPPTGSGGEVNWQATAETLQSEATRVSGGTGQQPVPTLVPAAMPATTAQPTLAYVHGGDIWVRPMPEGEAVRLTFDGRNQEPRWSASGEWLSYVKNPEYPELWVMRYDGRGATQIASGVNSDSYAWSPMEDRIVYTEMGTLFVMELQAASTPLLLTQVDVVPLDNSPTIDKVAWSPNGQTIAFTLRTETNGSLPKVEEATPDGLWLMDAMEGTPTQLLMSQVPDKGPFVLVGWSGDGESVLYWQAAILSASILSDGVPLYSIPAQGGSPEVIADPVLVHDDAVQSQPTDTNGIAQLAVVVGGGREMWHDKRLQVIAINGSQKMELTPFDQAVSSPAWSPSGDLIAYIGMVDLSLEQGHPDVNAVLQGRQLWIVEPNRPNPRPVIIAAGKPRIESPQWINDDHLLVASMDINGGASLIVTDIWGQSAQVVVDELTPAPEWFGYYGHVEWSSYFSLWRPHVWQPVAVPVEATPTLVPAQPIAANGPTVAGVLEELDIFLTSEKAVALWGEPDEVVGSGLIIYKYFLDEGLWLWLGFPGYGPMRYAYLETPSGKVFELTHLEEGIEAAATEAAVTAEARMATPTPAAMDATFGTPTPTAIPSLDSSTEATPTQMIPTAAVPAATSTPAPMIEPTATPLPIVTQVPPTAVAPAATATP